MRGSKKSGAYTAYNIWFECHAKIKFVMEKLYDKL
jgi:hypothetical protein